jgi:SAM-dependent methyltransferase
MYKMRSEQFREFTTAHNLSKGKIIEIGCGQGENLKILRQYCSKVYGLEYSPSNIDICKRDNLEVYEGFLDDNFPQIKAKQFDAFMTFNVLEHIPEPRVWLSTISKNFKPNTPGIIEVPNFDMIAKKGLSSEFMVEHLTYFTKRTLSLILEINGFVVDSIYERFDNYILSAQVRTRSEPNFVKFDQFKIDMKINLDSVITRHLNKSLVVWGAGHQSIAFINLFEISESVKYIVDSAFSKQGKFAPGTNLEIVKPSKLFSDPESSCVFVIAAGYNNEIIETLRKFWLKPGRIIYAVHEDLIQEITWDTLT